MEQMIIFVYDTDYCQTEADDPQKAVLFFHPHWVSDQQRLALCGQLMGAAHFCSTVFSTPTVLTLQCGKFVLRKFGRYILSVGSDQTLPEWILQERFNHLELLFQFYHKSFDAVFNRVECDQEMFSKKLTEILGIYLPILQCVVCAFGNVFVVRCPKKNSSAFLEAFQLLESCCNFKGVLGGVVLHNSRVIATQLDPDLTKLLALTNKFQIRSFAEKVDASFQLPQGTELVKVYLRQNVYDSLTSTANFKWAIFNGLQKKFLQKAGKIVKKKKDVNKIFTVKEEEDWTAESGPASKSQKDNFCTFKDSPLFKARKSKVENTALKERSKSFVGGMNLKVCSTPTVEKTLIHEELVSICSNNGGAGGGGTAAAAANGTVPGESKSVIPSNLVPDIVQTAINSKFRNRILSSAKYSHNRFFRISMDDLMVDFTHRTYPAPLKYYSFGFPKSYRELGQVPDSTESTNNKRRRRLKRRLFYKTIADPMNPVFKWDGVSVSKSLYNVYMDDHSKDFLKANMTIDSREAFVKSKSTAAGDETTSRASTNGEAEVTVSKELEKEEPVPKKSEVAVCGDRGKENSVATPPRPTTRPSKPDFLPLDGSELTRANQKAVRRSLSLPLKPLSFDGPENGTQNSVLKNKVLLSRTPTTPLTTKLSLLAFEEQQLDVKALTTPNDNNHLRTVTSALISNPADSKTAEPVATNLFVCGHQSMTLMLILDEGLEKNSDLVTSLWEASSATLKKVEHLRNKSLANLTNNCSNNNNNTTNHNNYNNNNTTTNNNNNNNSSYSFLSLDNQWGAIQRSGTWGDEELKVVGSLNNDLNKSTNVTEIILRNEDSVVYGYSCGGTKVFYQQGGCSSAGLPTPADLMGMVTLKARKRLERDRDVVLL